MNKHTRIGLMVLVTAVLLLALTIPGMAKKPPDFNLNYEFKDVNWDINYAEGSFTSIGEIEGTGDAILHWIPREIQQGTLFFKSGEDEFVARFSLTKSEEPDCGSGHFQIIEFRGEGIYETMRGNGDLTMCRPGNGDYVYGTLTGWVEFFEE